MNKKSYESIIENHISKLTFSYGFSLIELMITLLTLGLLLALAIPSYQKHVNQTQRSEIIRYAENLKIPVSKCIKKQLALQKVDYSECQQNKFNIPSDINSQLENSYIMCASVKSGVIKVVANLNNEVQADFGIQLTPQYKNKKITFIEELSTDTADAILSCL